jgi:son of sevenless
MTTFRTFMTADQLFDMLTGIYHMVVPEGLEEDTYDHDEWKDKRLYPTQRHILKLFRMWLQDFRLLEEEPNIAGRLTEFLHPIKSPQWQAHHASQIVEAIKELVCVFPLCFYSFIVANFANLLSLPDIQNCTPTKYIQRNQATKDTTAQQ